MSIIRMNNYLSSIYLPSYLSIYALSIEDVLYCDYISNIYLNIYLYQTISLSNVYLSIYISKNNALDGYLSMI